MKTEHDELDPLEPERAQELYLKQKKMDASKKTVQSHKYRLNAFIRWCDEKDIDNLNELTGRDLQEYRLWRQDDADLKKITLTQQMSTIRVFIKWCGSMEAVPADLYEKVMVPRVTPEEERSEEMLEAETAEAIREHLMRYHYASFEQTVFVLLWETGMRLGGAHSLDIKDIDIQNRRIELVHRPEQGTELKNGGAGERPIAITEGLAELLQEFIENTRQDITDEYGREPLFTTSHGRLCRNSIRRAVYRVTAPCFRNEPCPGCTGTDENKCPEAVSPHPIRRGSITHFLTKDIPAEIVSDRMNVSRDVLDKHYDRRSEEVKLEQRRGYLDNI